MKSDPVLGSLSDQAIEAIVKGLHGDPFAVLGRHQVTPTAMGGARHVAACAHGADCVIAGALLLHRWSGTISMASSLHASNQIIGQNIGYALRRPMAFVQSTILIRLPMCSIRMRFMHCTETANSKNISARKSSTHCGIDGVLFSVWAPNARRVSVVADFNEWDGRQNPMRLRHEGGLWELYVPGISRGIHYKFEVIAQDGHLLPLKADPARLRGRAAACDRLRSSMAGQDTAGATVRGLRSAG